MNDRFQSRIAVVTGAAQGIGAGIAERLVFEGAKVLVADLDLDAAEATARRLGSSASAFRLDVADRASVDTLPEATRTAFGATMDLLVCNAGVQTWTRAVDVTTEEWDACLDVNARGALYCLQMASRAMSQAVPGSPEAPAIVAMASIQGRLAGPYYPHYSASKAAVLSLVKSFAVALAPQGIRVNAVAPGIVDTPLWDRADTALSALTGNNAGEARTARIAAVPLQRAGTPADVAAAAAFLLSPDASYITGECVHVCGGDVML
ncbi:SDR family NAD(P)-dependent oxidoreductase [Mycolicibacterium goodii]|uniref:SDR family NAD(P)-dependent oxidoreductase n=1 Tax=Mycolicibacterium goodii TaxID=134601 RepID=UPI0013047272|nr:SDR family NAD(P)-dependent oxidoreductase [Mycolicibacterium goodii]